MAKKIIVSRHPAAVEYLKRYYCASNTPVLAEATPEDVAGKEVYGNLPLHLAVFAEVVHAVEFDGEPPRGREYTVEDMENAGAYVAPYKVLALQKGRKYSHQRANDYNAIQIAGELAVQVAEREGAIQIAPPPAEGVTQVAGSKALQIGGFHPHQIAGPGSIQVADGAAWQKAGVGTLQICRYEVTWTEYQGRADTWSDGWRAGVMVGRSAVRFASRVVGPEEANQWWLAKNGEWRLAEEEEAETLDRQVERLMR